MTRDQMEAHLTLSGWVPFNVGRYGAAIKDGVIVYISGDIAWDIARGTWAEVKVRRATEQDLNLGGARTQKRVMEDWWMSDAYFWPLANGCIESIT